MASDQLLQEYRSILTPQLGKGFEFGELVKPGNRRLEVPPTERLMRRMLATLELANELRARMVAIGCKGLRINAAYRPKGGAALSQHKYNRALDLDLLQPDYDKKAVYYEEAVKLWVEAAKHAYIGLGFYCPGDACAGIRVHIDVGGYGHSRTWQHGAHAGKADALIICDRLELKRPGHIVDDEGSDEESDETKKVSPPTAAGPSL